MIVITFAIQNPYFQSWKSFKNIRNWHGSTPFKNKYWEFELLKNGCIVEFDFTVRTRCDHAGTTLGLGLFGYSINATLYDNRHWDHKTDTWSTNELR
jgi:hypothetical protein